MNVMRFLLEIFAKGNCYHQNTSRLYPLVVRHVTAFLQQSKTGAQWRSSKNRQEVIFDA